MKHASYEITELKATGQGPKGLFAAIVSVFGNVDRNGDRVMRGAFLKSLARWKASGKPIPVIFSHEHRNPGAYIGEVDPDDVRETEKGLVVAGRLHIDTNPQAAQVYDLLQKNLVQQWSFAYEVSEERIADDLAREIMEADIFEVGPTLVGANPQAATLALASADIDPEPIAQLDPLITAALGRFEGDIDSLIEEKIGRVISTKTEAKIRSALAALTEILSSLGEPQQTEQASSTPETTEEPKPPVETERLRRQLEQTGLFLAERNR